MQAAVNDLAIQTEDLGKRYRIGEQTGYRTLRESLWSGLGSVWRRWLGPRRGNRVRRKTPTIWALRDVSFQVRRGEVVGVIGRNGAGKSTLLKLLARITEPTQGRAVVRGRVGSLLEVGTGFHPELTGRENLFLNGAILGMKGREIQRKFDQIVAFAEIERFIDTPVKRYSSGMYMRLAFAVAAHLEPEILVVDEVLAVGDAAFQRKCLDKMESVGAEGRTVLFVSHNLPAITRLCPRAVLLDEGRLVKDGSSEDVVETYLANASKREQGRMWSDACAPGTGCVRLLSVNLLRDGKPAMMVSVEDPLDLELVYHVSSAPLRFRCAASFFTQGVYAFPALEPVESEKSEPGTYVSRVRIPPNLLTEGEYTVGISMFSSRGVKQHFVRIDDAIAFHVTDYLTGNSARGDYAERLAGVVRPLLHWQAPRRVDVLGQTA